MLKKLLEDMMDEITNPKTPLEIDGIVRDTIDTFMKDINKFETDDDGNLSAYNFSGGIAILTQIMMKGMPVRYESRIVEESLVIDIYWVAAGVEIIFEYKNAFKTKAAPEVFRDVINGICYTAEFIHVDGFASRKHDDIPDPKETNVHDLSKYRKESQS